MNHIMVDTRNQLNSTIRLGAALKPLWLSQNFNGKPFFQHVMDILDEGMVMAYSNTQSITESWGDSAIAYANSISKRMEVAVEVDPAVVASDSYASMIQGNPQAFLNMLTQLDNRWAENPSYDGMTVHAWAQYFALLYSVQPINFVGTL